MVFELIPWRDLFRMEAVSSPWRAVVRDWIEAFGPRTHLAPGLRRPGTAGISSYDHFKQRGISSDSFTGSRSNMISSPDM